MAGNEFKETDNGYDQLSSTLAEVPADGWLITAGVHAEENRVYPYGEGGSVTLAMIAAFLEFGTGTGFESKSTKPGSGDIPQRSAFRTVLFENEDKYTDIIKTGWGKVLLEGMPVKQMLGQVAELLIGDVRVKIKGSIPPPNAEYTQNKKKSSTPWIDKGTLWQSFSARVE